MHVKICLLVIASLLSVPPAVEERFRFERPLMGTRFIVVVYANDQTVAANAANTAFELAENLNAVVSDYLPDSELASLTSKPIDTPISLSPLLYGLLDHSRRIAEATDGAFDPTLGSLTKLWRETRDHRCLPDPERLRTAQASVGWRHFSLDPTTRTITLHRQNMAFDLGGMAKGYAADLMLGSLASNGITKAMIAAGGDIRLGDPPPGRAGWRVALQTFDLARHDEVVTLSNAAVSTSGDLHQSVEIDGIRYSHILDPHTGLGLTRRIAAIAIADEAKLSDPFATAASVLGPDAGEKLRTFPGLRELKWRTPQDSLTQTLKNTPRNSRSTP
ncbi:FAD:protein FMN transferase [Phragmitibacter flavus]|uniref:FAD:protein FMN transferase n=1 Tax=Phragmitibacter flavus TaxID=2576071 RepID=A0A5R8KJK9_9BACT|nr:FAD:protein FMN transferase [Phragmitibacter flavus]TLD71799.1 FAD:protein FMN transferase [Phragmitibacter flavus]